MDEPSRDPAGVPPDAIRRLIGADSVDEIFGVAAEAGRWMTDADSCAFTTIEGDELVLRERSPAPTTDTPESIPLSLGLPGWTSGVSGVSVIDDLDELRGATAAGGTNTTSGGCRSMLSVPVSDVGVLLAMSDEPHAFDERDRERATRLANYVSAAVEREDGRSSHDGDDRNGSEWLDETLSVLVHDAKNPLNVARGSVELARERGKEEDFERLSTALDRIEELIVDARELARTGTGIEPDEAIDLGGVCESAWAGVPTRDATLVIEGTATVEGDRTHLCRLLENLFRNAVEHGSTSSRTSSDDAVEHGSTGSRASSDGSHAGSAVTVRVGTTEDGFYVEDDGPGIRAEERERVLEWRYSTAEGHTGVGLSVVGSIADAHGWDVSVTEAECGGARIEFAGVDLMAGG